MRVDQFYNRLPYPILPRPKDWAEPLRQQVVKSPPRRILHAGCATGSQTRSLAYTFPDAEIVGVDFADSSLALARKWLSEPAMKKVRFEKHDLREPLTGYGQFDFVLSYGVLHHIPEVDRAVANIRDVLAGPASPLVIFLYGAHGRGRIAQLQQALARWQELKPVSEAERSEALWAAASSNGTFKGLRGKVKRAMVLSSSYWRKAWESSNADAYLHPYVRYYDLDSIFGLLDRHQLELGGFVHRKETAGVGFPADEEAVARRFKITGYRELPERERLSIVDKLAAPKEYEFWCCKRPA